MRWPWPLFFVESALHALLNFFPYFLLALYPFRKKLRFSGLTTGLCIALLAVWEIIFDAFANSLLSPYKGPLSIANTLLYAAVYFILVNDTWRKPLFTLIALSSIANNISAISVFAENLIFRENYQNSAHWSVSVSMLLTQALFLVPLWFYERTYYTPIIQNSQSYLWKYLWLVPTLYYFIYFFVIYMLPNIPSYEMATKPETAVFMLFLASGSLLTYHLMIVQVMEQEEKLNILKEQRLNEITSLQYRNLIRNISEVRIARHDLRHHMLVMGRLLDEGKTAELKDYLSEYSKSVDLNKQLVYAEDPTANLIIGYYDNLSRQHGISFSARIKAGGMLFVNQKDLAALLGNLLGNAIEACRASKAEEKTIKLTILENGSHTLLISVENTADDTPLVKSEDGYKSTKHEGSGTGLFSVRHIAESYKGSLRIGKEEGLFTASVLLYKKENEPGTPPKTNKAN